MNVEMEARRWAFELVIRGGHGYPNTPEDVAAITRAATPLAEWLLYGSLPATKRDGDLTNEPQEVGAIAIGGVVAPLLNSRDAGGNVENALLPASPAERDLGLVSHVQSSMGDVGSVSMVAGEGAAINCAFPTPPQLAPETIGA
jgi:hypothetical protein